jgi:hypothetical protein
MTQVITGKYDLPKKQVNDLCKAFLTKSNLKTHFGCYLIEGTDKYSDLARYVEAKVFDETFKNDAATMLAEYGPYDRFSTFFVVIDHKGKMPVGALRVIKPSNRGLKSLVDLKTTPLKITAADIYKTYKIKPSECVDLATIAVEKQYRGRTYNFIPSLLLYRALYSQVLQDPSYLQVVSIVDKKPFELLLSLGMPFTPILNSKPFSYLSSDISYAVCAYTADFLPSVTKKASRYRFSPRPSRQYMRRLMLQLINGKGLDHMMGYLR